MLYASLAMKRTTIFLDESTERDLKTLAYRRNEPVALLVREAVARYIVAETEAAPRLPSFVGIGRSGFTDTAERHEELLFKGLEEEMGLPPRRARVAAKTPTTRKTPKTKSKR